MRNEIDENMRVKPGRRSEMAEDFAEDESVMFEDEDEVIEDARAKEAICSVRFVNEFFVLSTARQEDVSVNNEARFESV